MPDFIAALDQGTTNTRCLIVDSSGRMVSYCERSNTRCTPRAGWVEQDPYQLRDNAMIVLRLALEKAHLSAVDVAGLGIATQRETTIVWNRSTGIPYYNAISWQDTRTADIISSLDSQGTYQLIYERTGLPLATYFSASKLRWIIDHCPEVREDMAHGDVLFGTCDSWLVWNLTGGPQGGIHCTDVTNASRTMLMNLSTLQWDEDLLALFHFPFSLFAEINSSSLSNSHLCVSPTEGISSPIAISGILGDQHAALIGQRCWEPGQTKITYGTGNFLFMNTGSQPIHSGGGLITTMGYQLGEAPPTYALEGAVATTGAALQWLGDHLGIMASIDEVESLACSVSDSGGVYFVPALSGLFAPYWRPDTRGVIVGLSQATTKAHLIRAACEAICYQTREILELMERNSRQTLSTLYVDGGVSTNSFCMQLQADILGKPIQRPLLAQATALGACYVAGIGSQMWSGLEQIPDQFTSYQCWKPSWSHTTRARGYDHWRHAVQCSLQWADYSQHHLQ